MYINQCTFVNPHRMHQKDDLSVEELTKINDLSDEITTSLVTGDFFKHLANAIPKNKDVDKVLKNVEHFVRNVTAPRFKPRK